MAFTCDLHQLINAYLRRDNGCKTAFSQLNELHQQNYLAQPLVEQESLHEGLWRVVVHTSSASLGEITMEGQGTRKAVAKEQAAQLTLDEIRRCECFELFTA
jgi:dsRNA-specific ribonuclease